jgi:hypothetical protein
MILFTLCVPDAYRVCVLRLFSCLFCLHGVALSPPVSPLLLFFVPRRWRTYVPRGAGGLGRIPRWHNDGGHLYISAIRSVPWCNSSFFSVLGRQTSVWTLVALS